jgi:hypothetical protein
MGVEVICLPIKYINLRSINDHLKRNQQLITNFQQFDIYFYILVWIVEIALLIV